jgi:predicted metal-dependent peptidase
MTTPEWLLKGRFYLCKVRPYLAHAIYNCQFIETKGLGTMGMDKWGRIYYDPSLTWETQEITTVLEHEVWHLLRLHHRRFEDCPKERANVATDMEINDGMVQDPKSKFPGSPIVPSNFGLPDNLTAEEYYNMLPETPQIDHDCGSVSGGQVREWEIGSPAESGTPGLEGIKVEAIIQHVASEIKSIGNVGGDAQVWADSVTRVRIDPAKILRKFVQDVTTPGVQDLTWLRPNKRYSGSIILPGYTGRNRSNLVFLVDTSGSMSSKDIGLALGVIQKAIKGGHKIRVYVGDTRITGEKTPKKLNDLRNTLKGGGGTDMAGIIDDLDKNRRKPVGLIVITDGYTPWPSHRPSFPVAILITTHQDAPTWAKTIYLNEKE